MEKTLKLVLTCGHSDAALALVQDAVLRAGLAEASTPIPPWDPVQAAAQRDAWLADLGATPVACAIEFRADMLEQWSARADVRIVLVFGPPSWSLVGPFTRDASSSVGTAALLGEWVQRHTELLRFAARHPDRCLLVNALTVLHAPQALLTHLTSDLNVSQTASPVGKDELDRSAVPAIESALMAARIEPTSPAALLYGELESLATLDSGPLALDAREQAAADEELAQLRSSHDGQALMMAQLQQALGDAHASRVATESAVRELNRRLAQADDIAAGQLQRLHDTQEELESLFLQRRDGDARHAAALSELAKAGDATRQVLSERQVEVDQLTRALAERQAKLDALVKAGEQLKLEHSQVLTRVDALGKEVTAAKAAARAAAMDRDGEAARRADLARSSAESAALRVDKELLLIQLHQVQEELEHHYLLNQKLLGTAGHGRDDDSRLRRLWQRNQPADVVLDLRETIDGDGWYDPEADGRWTGPEATSTLVLPALLNGLYSVQLDVVDAVTPEVLAGLRVTLNDREVPLANDAATGLPGYVLGTISVDADHGRDWTLALTVPKCVPPREIGLEDDRPLGLRLRSVTFTLLESLPVVPTA